MTMTAPSNAITLRPYQGEAISAVYEHLRTRDDHPCVVIPTAGGKTPVMATICRDAVKQWDGRVLILAHVKELLEQAVDKLHAMAPDLWHQIGVYSAGLRSRDTDHPIIVAGIQSVYRRAAELDRFDLILIDEAHMIPPGAGGDGMYQQFLRDAKIVNPNVRLIGLTATPYRMTTGTICAPAPDGLLNHVCYEVGVRELIVQGYLCPLKTKAGKRKVDMTGLHIRGGEFIAGEVEALMDDDSLVRSRLDPTAATNDSTRTCRSQFGRRTKFHSEESPMPCVCVDNTNAIERVAHLLDAVKRVDVDVLERIVQQAHECNIRQIDDPPEPFPITRQALRMFWHFRCNLESVQVRTAND